jgi:hypothetical protein
MNPAKEWDDGQVFVYDDGESRWFIGCLDRPTTPQSPPKRKIIQIVWGLQCWSGSVPPRLEVKIRSLRHVSVSKGYPTNKRLQPVPGLALGTAHSAAAAEEPEDTEAKVGDSMTVDSPSVERPAYGAIRRPLDPPTLVRSLLGHQGEMDVPGKLVVLKYIITQAVQGKYFPARPSISP